MKKLNLPNFEIPMLEPEPLSMEGYQKFVDFYLRCGFDRSYYEEQKKKRMVNVAFRLRPSKFRKA
ncbi:MAG: hypothetical protein HY587_02515 [Candidatus Omnitrophica bacterium]|nr:hypothetical protein [Candidatus Omnitrophota bacterium]